MNATTDQVLKARFSNNGQIYFSFTKIIFQKNLQSFMVPIIIVPIMLISNTLNLYNAHLNDDKTNMVFFSTIFIVLTIFSWFRYQDDKQIDGQEYKFKDIKNLRIKESRKVAKLNFEFTNSVKHKMSIKKDASYTKFIRRISIAEVPMSTI